MQETDKPSLTFASIVFAVVLVGVISWTVLGGLVLGLTSLYAGFLFLWYWGEKEGAELNRFVRSLAGALCGLGLAWLLKGAPAAFGNVGFALALVCVAAAVFLHISQLVPFFINSATMLFLTVGAAPIILSQTDFVELTAAMVIGATLFGGIVFAARWIGSRSAAQNISEPS